MKIDHEQIERELRATAGGARVAPSQRLRIATVQRLTEAAREQGANGARHSTVTAAGRRWAAVLAGCGVVAAVIGASIALYPVPDANDALVQENQPLQAIATGHSIEPGRVADVARLLISTPDLPRLKDAATEPLMREARLIARNAEKSWQDFKDRLPKLPRAQSDSSGEL